MRFKILPLEERIVLDAALAPTIHGVIDEVTVTDTVDTTDINNSSIFDPTVAGNLLYFTRPKASELMVTDGVNTTAITLTPNDPDDPYVSIPQNLIAYQDHLYFQYDNSLWVSDGTQQGTTRFIDTFTFEKPVIIGGILAFAKDGDLWRTNGTLGGTSAITSDSLSPRNFINVNGTLYFTAYDGNGEELWKSDGSESGTAMVKDINSGGSGITYASQFVAFGNQLLFTANDGINGLEPWISDGTEAGTVMLKDINSTGDSLATNFLLSKITVIENPTNVFEAYFVADDGIHGQELWKTDGTEGGTNLVQDLSPGLDSTLFFNEFHNYKNTLYFTAATSNSFFEKIWTYDGTNLSLFNNDIIQPTNLVTVDNYLYFTGSGFPIYGTTDLFRTDGTLEGTQGVFGDFHGPTSEMINFNDDLLIFDSFDDDHLDILTGLKTIHISVNPGSSVDVAAALSGSITNPSGQPLQYVVDTGPSHGAYNSNQYTPNAGYVGQQDSLILHVNDGQKDSNQAIIKFDIGLPAPDSPPTVQGFIDFINLYKSDIVHNGATPEIVTVGNLAYFVTQPDINSNVFELWETNGTFGGTHTIAFPESTTLPFSNIKLLEFKNRLYVNYNMTLWALQDGDFIRLTSDDINISSSHLAHNENELFFVTSGNYLGKSDGTAIGTSVFKNLEDPSASNFAFISKMISAGDLIYIVADDGLHGVELWKSDGTAAGTVLVKDIFSGSGNASPLNLGYNPTTGLAYFAANDGSNGWELWKSDGTENGTVLVKDITPGVNNSTPHDFFAIGNKMYFIANDYELWVTDGTDLGTIQLRGNDFSNEVPSNMIDYQGKLYFTAINSDLNSPTLKVWTSDGTVAGTHVVLDNYFAPDSLIVLGDYFYFMAIDNNNDMAGFFVRSDGTDLGTVNISNAATFEQFNLNGSMLWMRNFPENERIWLLAGLPEFAFSTSANQSFDLDAALGNDVFDPEGQSLQYIVVDSPDHGTVFTVNGAFIYTPTNGYTGSDSIKFRVQDPGGNLSKVAEISLTVTNNAPVANDDPPISLSEDAPPTLISPLDNDTDNDGPSPLSVIILTNPLHGLLTPNGNGTFYYTPNVNFNGLDSFTYQAYDGAANSNTVTVHITVNPINDAPNAVDDIYKIKTKTTTLKVAKPGVLKNDIDAEGQKLTAKLLTKPKKGTVTFNKDGSFTYKPNSKFKTTDTFTYQASDGALTDTATVTIQLKGKAGVSSTSSSLVIRSVTPVDSGAVPAPSSKGLFDRLYEKWFG